jgi:hypothetical protein
MTVDRFPLILGILYHGIELDVWITPSLGNSWNDDLEELAWRHEEELQPGSNIDSWTGGSRAEGSSEALESEAVGKESKGPRRRK